MRPDLVDWLTPYVGKLIVQLLVPPYALILIGAVLLGTAIALRRMQRRGLDIVPYLTATIIGYFAMFVGGRLGYILFNFNDYLDRPITLLMPWKGGFASFGAFGLGAVAGWAYLTWRKVPFWPFADAAAPGAALVLGCVRLGCALQGCCHGAPTNSWWGVTYQKGRMAWKSQLAAGLLPAGATRTLPTYPTQLLEALLGFALFLWLSRMWQKQRFAGQTFWSFWIAYGLARFMTEFLRGDPRLMAGPLSAAQLVSLGIFITGIVEYRRGSSVARRQ